MKFIPLSSLISLSFLIFLLGIAQPTDAQQNLILVDKDRLYQVENHLVKNQGLIVVSDLALTEAGLTLHQVGFRKNPYSQKTELLIQFKALAGFVTDLGVQLFGSDRETIWQDSIVRTDQPQEHNIISMIVRTPITELKTNSELHLWARAPIKKIPYEMWEWMDMGPSEWLVLSEDSLPTTLQTDSSIIYNENEVSQKPVFNHHGESDLEYIARNINYPVKAKENDVQGVVVIQFTIAADGSVGDAEITRDIGGGCGEEALKIIRSMPLWTPGTVDEKAVPVRVTRPIRFKW